MTFTVAAVDDHPTMLLGLAALLDPVADIEFQCTAETVPELLRVRPLPDVVLLDLRLDDGSRPGDNVRQLVAAGLHVVIYTAGFASRESHQALAAGALTVVSKNADPAELLDALREAATGNTLPTTEMAQALETAENLGPTLSSREQEALRLYAANLPAKSVARRMNVSEGTVKVYLRRIRAKYAAMDRDAHTKLDLYHRAMEDGLIEPME